MTHEYRHSLHTVFRQNLRCLMSFFVPCILLFLAAAGIWTYKSWQMEALQYNAYADRSSLMIQEELAGIASSAELMSYSTDVRAFALSNSSKLSEKMVQPIQGIQQQCTVLLAQYDSAVNVTLYFSGMDYFVFPHVSYRRKLRVSNVEETIADICALLDDSGWYVTSSDLYYYHNTTYNGENRVTLIVRIPCSALNIFMSKQVLDSTIHVFIANADGTVFADSIGGTTHRLPAVSYFQSRDCVVPDFKIVYYDTRTWYEKTGNMLLPPVIVCAALLITMILVLYRSARLLCKPYEAILALLEKPEILSSNSYDKNYRAIDQLGMIYTLIHQRNYQYLALKEQLSEKELSLREAQNAMLQAQINPHFLFNTLDNINWMAYELLPEDNKVSASIQMLSQLLRLSLCRTDAITTIREEIEHARLYLQIQQMRMEHVLNISWNVDESIIHCRMLCLSLQPILENAISHGIKGRINGKIHISIQPSGDGIMVQVSDNGEGITPEMMNELQERLDMPFRYNEQHIGLANINARIHFVYGDQGSLRIQSTPEVQTTVTMCFPR